MLTGYSPVRHRRGVDVMLLKKENVYDIDKLRTIVLFDTEANMNNKHTGRRAMNAAIRKKMIVDEQYSRPHRKAIDHSLNRRLIMDHQLYLRQPYTLTSCDLKSCYDRINHTSASLCLQKAGIQKPEITAMFQTIQRMQHQVRTAFGDSQSTYGGDNWKQQWNLPPQGVLQGNGAGPTIWTIISSMLFSILGDNNFRNTFLSPLRDIHLKLAGFAYVDDTDLIQVGNRMRDAVQRMQTLLVAWAALVQVTGGLLAPEKCWSYLVDFEYKKGKWTTSPRQNQYTLTIPTTSRTHHTLKQLPTNKGSNMLGVVMSPDGNNSDHILALRSKSQQWASHIRNMGSNVNEIWTALHRTIPFRLCYSLQAVSLGEKDCRYIMAPIHKEGLPRAGIPSTIPIEIRHGPIDKGGLGILDLYLYQGTSQIANLVSSVWAGTPTGKLLQIAIDDFFLEMGLQSLTPRNLERGLKYATTTSWIRHVFGFMVEKNIWISSIRPEMKSPRGGDITIMQKALEFTTDRSKLRAINRVRMALQVFWISEICVADGTDIDHSWMTQRYPGRCRNSFKWPLQHKTSYTDWAHWRRFLHNSMAHLPVLQAWQGTEEEWITSWDIFVNETEDQLFIRNQDGSWNRHIRYEDRRRRDQKYYTEFLVYRELPAHHEYKRATIRIQRNHILVIALFNNRIRETTEDDILYRPLPQSKTDILNRIQFLLEPDSLEASDDISQLLQDFADGTVIAISDGSYFPHLQKAAGAWIIESRCRSQWIMGSMTCRDLKMNSIHFGVN
jgi:Reverse transcriptase (RNA-dependent DNA polymerase).